MSNVDIALRILERGEIPCPGYKKSSGKTIYTVKMDFTRKAWWFKDRNRTTYPESSIYDGVVSRESIIIMLMFEAMHGVPMVACDARNAYMKAPTFGKTLHYLWT